MKRILFLLFSIILLLGVSSCKKCTTCEIRKLDGTVEASYEEYCGTKDDLDRFKEDLEIKTANQLGQNGQVICNDK